MMRILSILLLLAGLLAAGIGGAALMETYLPRSASEPAAFETPPPPPPPSELPMTGPGGAALPDEDPGADPTEDYAAIGELAVDPPAEVAVAPEAYVSEEDFNFQPMVEEAPAAPPSAMARSAAPPAAIDEPVDIESAPASKAAFIDSLKTVPVAHETPRSAEYKRPFDVTFAINATGEGADATGSLPGRGMIETGEARVSERVEVRLSGAAFSITPTSPPVQLLSPVTDNTWRWSVVPLTAGNHELVFEIFAMDADDVVPLRTFRDNVTVRVSGINRAIAFADQANPLFVLLGGLGSAIAGLVGAIRFFGRK